MTRVARIRAVVTLTEAMRIAIRTLGGRATVAETRDYIARHFAHRDWSPKSVGRYFYMLARPQVFSRVKRGTYTLASGAARRRAA